jgi:fructose-1,6-bisphosphatase
VKNLQNTIPIEEKLHTISRLEKGEQIVGICHIVRLADSSVHIIGDIVDRFTESAISGRKVFV